MPPHGLLAEKDHQRLRLLLLHRDQAVSGKSVKALQDYLGTPDQILQKCSSVEEPDPPVKTSRVELGLPGALYQQALELRLIPLFNSYASGASAHLDVGQYLVLWAINRVCELGSRNGIGSWRRGTSLPSLFTIPLDALIYDTTNFFSYLAEQTSSELNEKGHNKAFRHHLRQVGLAVSVVRGLGAPLIHELYGRSENDATLFPTAMGRTIERVRQLSDGRVEDLTVVFDKGNNSSENIRGLAHEGVHFIGSLSLSHYPELCSAQLSRYTPLRLDSGEEIPALDTKVKAFGRSIRVVLTHNHSAARKQEKRFQKDVGRALAELNQVRWAKVKDPKAKIRELVGPSSPHTSFNPKGAARI